MNTVLVTGATGAIGSALVPLFLQEDNGNVCLILRASSAAHLKERFEALLSFWGYSTDSPVAQRLQVLAGDVTQPLLGLEHSEYRSLASRVSHVIHAAGNVKLNQTLEEARNDAVRSTNQVIGFAQACRAHGQFRKLEFVSTVGVAGRHPGLVREQPVTARRTFHNTYEQAKAEAEDCVLQEISKGLPATIHRPSMVVGDSRTGKIMHFQVFYHLSEFCSGTKTWGFVPDTGDFRLDIIPADYVAAALYLSSGTQESVGQIFNLCSGPLVAMPLIEMTHQIRQMLKENGKRVTTLRSVHPKWFRRALPLACMLAPRKMRRSLQGLPYFLDYLEERQTFDNVNAQAFFSKRGLSVPRIERYLDKVLQNYWHTTKTLSAAPTLTPARRHV
jgi:thioester reductase-like protein